MKKLCFFYIITILINFYTYSQNNQGKIIYGKQIIADLKNSNLSNDASIYETGETGLEYELKFNNQETTFNIIESLDSDANSGFSFSKSMGGGKGIYYANLNTNDYLRQLEAFGEEFLLTEFLRDVKWTITKDTMIIGNMLCYKATSIKTVVRTKNTYVKPITAWFTLEIPLSYGPIGYNGLPGLILDLIIENEVRYYAKKIELNQLQVIIEPIKGKKMTEKEFEAKGKEMYENFKESYRRKKD